MVSNYGFCRSRDSKGTFAYVLSRLHHMILPAITAAILRTTGTIQYLRNEVIDAKTQDYVKLQEVREFL